MTAIAEYPAARNAARKLAIGQYKTYFIFTLCASLYLLPFMRLLLQGTDEGLFVYDALRVVHGQVFARDFLGSVGPGTFYWLAAFFKVFGISFFVTRIYLFIGSLGTGLLMYFLSRRICKSHQTLPCVLLVGTSFGMLWPGVSHHLDSNFLALLAVACMVVWKDTRRNSLLMAAGVLAGAATWFVQPKGVFLLLGLLVWLWLQGERRWALSSPYSLVIGSYCGAVGLVLIYFWSHAALWSLIYANFVWPSAHYGDTNAVAYAQGIIQSYWNLWAPVGGADWRVFIAAILIAPFVFVAVLPGLLLVLGVRRGKAVLSPELSLYWLCGWALWLAEIHRKDICHLVFGSPLLIILCVFYLEEWRARAASIALQVLTICAVCLAGFNLFLVLSARSEATRVGSVALLRPDPVVELLNSKTAPKDNVFVYPYCPMYYFLSDTTNPTRYDSLIDEFSTASQFHEVIGVLNARRVKYVVWNTGFEDKSLGLFFPAVKRVRSDQLIMEPYLESHYRTVWADKTMRLMERKSDDQPAQSLGRSY